MKIWLAWAPSSWKSSVVQELSDRWHTVYLEAATQIITKRMDGWESIDDILSSPAIFQEQIHTKKVEQLNNSSLDDTSFFDTTTVEDIAHRKVTWVEIKSIQKTIDEIRYDNIFYMVHPWKVEDNGIRVENETEVQELDRLKREAFKDNWYNIVEVPTFVKDWTELTDEVIEEAVKQRVDFILSVIKG